MAKNYDALRVLILDDEVRAEGTMLISIEDDSGNASATVLVERDEAVQIIDHLEHIVSIND
ncbi:hypothetical protein [Nitrosospira sp. Is2]|uniref:hypothetical protein n=1 Tax=Nitrosospira sp. Is2 TaxID=3080532 RepID=UPI00295308C3|nr:hypothetical protein [Nitrosospira sp. Is2]WON73215.1 hypothetical protein R5L00_12075 [Nitrosospira sp. Is2]